MSLYFPVFIVSVLIAFGFLVLHSIKHRGARETLIFFGYGFLFGFIREIVYRFLFKNYSVTDVPLQILGVPVAVIFGWLFTFYLGYCFCQKFLVLEKESEYMRLIVLCAIFSSYICFSIETAAMYMGWWEVFFESSNFAASDLLAGWFYSTLLFFSIYFVLIGKIKSARNLLLPILIIVLIASVELIGQLAFTFNEIGVILYFFVLLAIVFFLYPYLTIFLLPLTFLFMISPIRSLVDNNARILIFFVIEFAYLVLILKYSKVFEMDLLEKLVFKKQQIKSS